MKIKFSKSQWVDFGKKQGWIKEAQLGEVVKEILRFDLDARTEILIDRYDVEQDDEYKTIMESAATTDQKVAQLKVVATRIAQERLSEVKELSLSKSIDITAHVTMESMNIDRINWLDMIRKYEENKRLNEESL